MELASEKGLGSGLRIVGISTRAEGKATIASWWVSTFIPQICLFGSKYKARARIMSMHKLTRPSSEDLFLGLAALAQRHDLRRVHGVVVDLHLHHFAVLVD
jgi:hypothetical protein